MARLKEKYRKEIVAKMQETRGFKNVNQVPRLQKIVINMGVGEATQNIKVLDEAVEELTAITGQKPVVTRSKVAISNFKVRQNMPIGCKVTLRGDRMYEFMDRLISVAMPRIRDFNGVPRNSFDGRGNYTLGIKEQIIFPEIKFEKVQTVLGMDITFVTNAGNDADAFMLLEFMGMPFKKK
ncbi:MAG TPA: 50S ribosomal protein L5 [Candidatus Goldiibacteriota bacterium]|nr:50S ribosomal protein L5 [Candidatus Goldiibacteriota bacterium]